MPNVIRTSRVYRSLNKSLTLLGVERQLFFAALLTASLVFNVFGSLLGGFLMFAVLFVAARLATAKDPQLLRILLNAAKHKTRYDSAKQFTTKEGVS